MKPFGAWLAAAAALKARSQLAVEPRVLAKLAKQACSIAVRDFDQHHPGRVAAAIVFGLACDPTTLPDFERKGLLFRLDSSPDTAREVVDRLSTCQPELARLGAGLERRLSSYINLHDVAARVGGSFRRYREYLRARPLGTIKALLAVVEARFLSRVRDVPKLIELLPPFALRHEAEHFAEIVSMVVAEAVEFSRFRAAELNQSIVDAWRDPGFERLLVLAELRYELRRINKYVSAMGYRLDLTPPHSFVLRHDDPEFDEARRLATINYELRRRTLLVGGPPARAVSVHQLMDSARLDPVALSMRLDPYERFVVEIPSAEFWPWDALEGMFSEDLTQLAEESYEFVLARQEPATVMLREGLSLADYLRFYRRLRTFALVMSGMLARQAGTEPAAVANSLVNVFPSDSIKHLTGPAAHGFVESASWRPGDGHLDLQYSPILHMVDHAILCPRLLVTSAPFRNALVRHSARFDEAGARFVETVETSLRQRFQHVALEKLVRFGGRETDADIAVLVDGRLFLFECKYSIPAASIHEEGDHWADIRKAARQLRTLAELLRAVPDFGQRLQSWFPDASIPDPSTIEFVPCVLTSTRTLSGWHIEDIPVRDFFGLRNVLTDGELTVFEPSVDSVTEHTWSIWKSEQFIVDDLVDFLSRNSRVVELNRAFCSAVSHINYSAKALTLAEETVFASIPGDMDELVRRLTPYGLRYTGKTTRARTPMTA